MTGRKMTGRAWFMSMVAAAVTMPALALAADEQQPPPRDLQRSAMLVPDAELWKRFEYAGQVATVGLKVPGTQRGVWRGVKFINDTQLKQLRQQLLEVRGVTLKDEDEQMPRLHVHLEDRDALARVRALPYVDYVEPAASPKTLFSGGSSGCDQTTYMPNSTTGDIVPWNFWHIDVPRAWDRHEGKGAGVTVGIVDTGLFEHQSQLWNPGFTGGLSAGRTHQYVSTNSNSYYDTCGHGTRMAGTILAPSDGQNVVGVAYRANLSAARALNGVWTGTSENSEIVTGIRNVVFSGARIIVMAFGQATTSNEIEDEIQAHYYSKDVLFIGAAGTLLCLGISIFPADMDEVVSVTGLTENDTLHPDACGFPSTDIGAVIGTAPTTGSSPDSVIGIGGSSNATALVSGVAALVWSKYPHFNRDQVRDRLYQSTGKPSRTEKTGWGRVNAYYALGGFRSLELTGNSGRSVAYVGETISFSTYIKGEGPFSYQWSNGATSPSTTMSCTHDGQGIFISVTVRDLIDGTTKSDSRSILCREANPGGPGDPAYCDTKPWLCDPRSRMDSDEAVGVRQTSENG